MRNAPILWLTFQSSGGATVDGHLRPKKLNRLVCLGGDEGALAEEAAAPAISSEAP